MNAIITTTGNQSFLEFFNSKEVYSVKGFDTARKAKNYATKWNIKIHENLPVGVSEFQYCD